MKMKFLTLVPFLLLIAMSVGCHGKEEKWEKTQMSMDNPLLGGPSKVLEVFPEIPKTGTCTALVESMNGDKNGKVVQSLELISTSLQVKAGDYVRITEGHPFNLKTKNYEKRVIRLVSLDLAYSTIAQTERRQALAEEKKALDELEQAKKKLAEENKTE